MNTTVELLKEKRDLLLEVFEDTKIESRELDGALVALAKSNSKIELIRILDESIRLSPSIEQEEQPILDEIRDLLLKIQNNMKKISGILHSEKRMAAESMSDFARIKSIKNSYVKVEQGPVFIDKDFE